MFVYLGFNVAFNTVQVISRRVVGRAEELTSYVGGRTKYLQYLCDSGCCYSFYFH